MNCQEEDTVEDIVGDVKYTESQKSVSTSNLYSLDFTDFSSSSNSDKKGSLSGKETYVIEWDSEDSDNNYQLHDSKSIVNLYSSMAAPQACKVNVNVQYEAIGVNKSAATSFHKSAVFAQETFTQTSKTLLELVGNDGPERKQIVNNSLETQTSFISIKNNKTVEYLIEVSSPGNHFREGAVLAHGDTLKRKPAYYNITCNEFCSSYINTTDDTADETVQTSSSKILSSGLIGNDAEENPSNPSLSDKVLNIIDDEVKDTSNNDNNEDQELGSEVSIINSDTVLTGTSNGNKSEINDFKNMVREYAELVSDDQLNESFVELEIKRFSSLTPLTEESGVRNTSIIDVTPDENLISTIEESDSIEKKDDELLFMNNGIMIKFLKEDEKKEPFKLPPIQQSCATSPHINTILAAGKVNKLFKAGTLPCLYENEKSRDSVDRWEMGSKELASGEGALINGIIAENNLQLPPIHAEGSNISKDRVETVPASARTPRDSISIKEKIRELKMCTRNVRSYTYTKYNSVSRTESRSNSPGSVGSPDEQRLADVVERGCEALVQEILRRLRLPSWYDVMDTLDQVPSTMEKYWNIIPEQRIADLIRQVNVHLDSPRPQVLRSACTCLGAILKNTNYTKKPDFYESITALLTKTGSYSRPVRRAANMALDEIVCAVDICHSVSAVCVHGACHKNALVRSATARLLVVCGALAGGGRDLLKARPTSAAAARKHALTSLSLLLTDKNTDARKYAERLYAMLRPLPHFEAYFLTDVDVEQASRQMKKYDQLLQPILPNKDTRKYAERLYAMLRPLPHFEAYFLTDVDVEQASRQMKKYDQLLQPILPNKDTSSPTNY